MSDLGCVIVTGAARGIGRSTAVRLLDDGYDIAAVDLDWAGVASLSDEVTDRNADLWTYELDLRDGSKVARVVDDLLVKDTYIHGLVNNAGIGARGTVLETDLAEWNNVLQVNLTSMYHTVRAVLPTMLARGSGSIVNVGSFVARVAARNRVAYCVSKAGVLALTRCVAADFAQQGIRANAICPGTVETDLLRNVIASSENPSEVRRLMEERQLDRRLGRPEEVAAGIAFLIDKEARFVNGAEFAMDGGGTAAVTGNIP